MFDPKEFAKSLGIDLATLEQMAKSGMDMPFLREIYERSVLEEGFNESIEKLTDEIKDLFNHVGTPK